MIDVAIASRSHPHEVVNGDDAVVRRGGGCARIAVIDGLGHGRRAHAAAQAARQVLFATPPGRDLELVLRECHRALRPTRGAALTLAKLRRDETAVELLGVGNVAAVVLGGARPHTYLPARGIVGARLPTLRPQRFDLAPKWALVMMSDGIRSGLDLSVLEEAPADELQAVAWSLLRTWARSNDDATLLIARPSAS